MSEDRKRQRKVMRHMQSESTWLQKALFALRKAEDAHEKLAESRGEEADSYTLSVGGGAVAVTDVEDALEERVERLMKTVREMRRESR